MRTILFSSQTYDRDSFLAADLPADIELHFQSARLSLDTVALAEQHEVVCAFINDDLGAPVLERLAAGGTDMGSIIASLASGGVGGGVLMAIIGVVKNAMAKS